MGKEEMPDRACGKAPATKRVPLEATGLPPSVPTLQTLVMDQVIPEEEVGCFVPGRELVLSMLRWICETFAFETAYDLLQCFPRFCAYRRSASIQLRDCERLLFEIFPDRMDFTHKRRLFMAFEGENKNYTQGEWLRVLHQESRGKFELEYRMWRRILHATLPQLDENARQEDQRSREREAAYRKRKQEELAAAEAAEAAAKAQQEAKAKQARPGGSAASSLGAASENSNPNTNTNARETRSRRSRR